MVTIIGRGSEADRAALKLWTIGNRTFIENEMPEGENAPEQLQAALRLSLQISPTAKCRSLTAMYNCVGLVFASRRTVIDCKHLATILTDDGYKKITREEVEVGDVVVYARDGIAQHVGIIYRLPEQLPGVLLLSDMWVLSQWGENGEYLHKLDEVPTIYGNQKEFWSERRRVL